MSTVDPKILSKIKKCLALSNSPNPHEAAVAMSQAQALMRKYGVDAHHVVMSEVGEASTKSRTMARDKPTHWEALLVATVGRAFGCKVVMNRCLYPKEIRGHVNEGEFVFIGQKTQAEIAAYTAEVLSRKCKAARQKWIAETLNGLGVAKGGKAKVTRMGNLFAEGWVYGIDQLVTDFANPPEIEQVIEQRMANVGGKAPTRQIDKKDVGKGEAIAALAGAQAAKGESLYRPMPGSAPQAAISMVAGGAV